MRNLIFIRISVTMFFLHKTTGYKKRKNKWISICQRSQYFTGSGQTGSCLQLSETFTIKKGSSLL